MGSSMGPRAVSWWRLQPGFHGSTVCKMVWRLQLSRVFTRLARTGTKSNPGVLIIHEGGRQSH